MRCSRVQSRLQAFADGALTEREARGIERHVSGCDACRLEFESLRALDHGLSAEPLAEPPAELRAAILSRAIAKAGRAGLLPVPRWLDGITYAGFALALLAAGAVGHAAAGVSVTLLQFTVNLGSAAVIVLCGGIAILASLLYGTQY
ncbi:MAG: zf-HC2 domain-containing protein [Armatimonadota bacterium]|nr:MAG: zf-HC2 domain-containing protein [Armatimonadota bacterium]